MCLGGECVDDALICPCARTAYLKRLPGILTEKHQNSPAASCAKSNKETLEDMSSKGFDL